MRCVPAILAARNRRLGTPLGTDDLTDLCQDVLVVIWKKLPGFAGHSSLESWAYRICSLEIMNAIRAKRRLPTPLADPPEGGGTESDERPGRSLMRQDQVVWGLDHLGPPAADVIYLKHFQYLTFEEIADRLGVSPNTAKSQYYRGLRKLRELLGAPSISEEAS
jgi:RNA polymerase sigma-70 factor (ECF subfamily)